MFFSEFVIVGVMGGSDFKSTRTEFTINIIVRNDDDFSVTHRHFHCEVQGVRVGIRAGTV